MSGWGNIFTKCLIYDFNPCFNGFLPSTSSSDNVKRATVVLTATNASGQTYMIGETTTDTAGNFGKSWIPPAEGDYMIKAAKYGLNLKT